MKDSIVLSKSKAFSVRIVRLCRYLRDEKKEFILSNQLLRSGTSIGANVHEGKYAQSTDDFILKKQHRPERSSRNGILVGTASRNGVHHKSRI